jgi:hypothetical protein
MIAAIYKRITSVNRGRVRAASKRKLTVVPGFASC